MITMGSQLINATIVNNPQLHELLPEGLNDVFGSALDNGYHYGREWIGNMVSHLMNLLIDFDRNNRKSLFLSY